MTLGELQEDLRETCGVEASKTTISATLRRRGFTRKMVRIESHYLRCADAPKGYSSCYRTK